MTQDFLTSYGLAATVFPWQEVWRRQRPIRGPDRAQAGPYYRPARTDRGAPFPTAGWDLGRNDHTDEVGEKRSAETMVL